MSGAKHKRPVAPPKGKGGNPWLNQLQAQFNAQEQADLENLSELDRTALMLTVHGDLQVGPGRAAKIINDYMTTREELATRFLSESKEDNEVLVLKRDIAFKLKETFGEKWEKYREYFPMVKIYW